MTDPVADMLTRIRNANLALHDTVETECFDLEEETRVSQARNLPTMARYRRPRTTGESRS